MNLNLVRRILNSPQEPNAKESQLLQAIDKYKTSLQQIAFLAVVAALQSGLVT